MTEQHLGTGMAVSKSWKSMSIARVNQSNMDSVGYFPQWPSLVIIDLLGWPTIMAGSDYFHTCPFVIFKITHFQVRIVIASDRIVVLVWSLMTPVLFHYKFLNISCCNYTTSNLIFQSAELWDFHVVPWPITSLPMIPTKVLRLTNSSQRMARSWLSKTVRNLDLIPYGISMFGTMSGWPDLTCQWVTVVGKP